MKRLLCGLAVAAGVLTGAACGPVGGTDPSWNPFKACPRGMVRVKDVTQPPPKQWVCVR